MPAKITGYTVSHQREESMVRLQVMTRHQGTHKMTHDTHQTTFRCVWFSMTMVKRTCCTSCLVPRPPPFCSSVCVQYNTHGSGRAREKRGMPWLIHHMNDVRWTRGGRRNFSMKFPFHMCSSYYSVHPQKLCVYTRDNILRVRG